MVGETKSKAELRELLQQQCDEAMFLDSSIYTLYAAAPEPSSPTPRPHKPKPLRPSELEQPAQASQSTVMEVPVAELSEGQRFMKGLEEQIEEFLRRRR